MTKKGNWEEVCFGDDLPVNKSVIYKTAKTTCCEAKLYFKAVGQWSAVFKRCKECEND